MNIYLTENHLLAEKIVSKNDIDNVIVTVTGLRCHRILIKHHITKPIIYLTLFQREKTGFLPRRKQRRRSASR